MSMALFLYPKKFVAKTFLSIKHSFQLKVKGLISVLTFHSQNTSALKYYKQQNQVAKIILFVPISV